MRLHRSKALLLTTSLLLLLNLTGCSDKDQAVKQMEQFIAKQAIDKTKENWKTQLTSPDLVSFSADKQYLWDLTTNKGLLTIKLMPEVAPMHVTSTIYLTQLGFYDGLSFHRVIPGFMAQGGDPLGNGSGNPGYKYQGEFVAGVSHDKGGLLSMANSGPGTDGSQFFITFKQTPFLDGKHTIFGEVVEGAETTLKTIEKMGSRRGKTSEPLLITQAKIRITS
jgi:peptidyl-prolyl cis-trans isomerase B (cyclophilin B)